jgi:hypothetical protein
VPASMLSFHFSPRAAQSRSASYLPFVLGFSLSSAMFSPDPVHGVPFPLPVMIFFAAGVCPAHDLVLLLSSSVLAA